MEYVGAAQELFDTFMNLARSMLDIYWPNWNNITDPMSYISPPTFSFKNPDKSDRDIEEIKSELEQQKEAGVDEDLVNSLQRPVIDRHSDFGEFTVFLTLWSLVQEKVQAPLLVIHSLNLGNLMGHLQEIFPFVPCAVHEKFKAMMREYDFILIGPQIGIIVIEVKSSAFTKKNHFAVKQRHLPDQILYGIEQLKSFDPEFFQACSGVFVPSEVPVRRVLITPNLEKTRFDEWCKTLDVAAKQKVDKLLIDSGIIHWFKEDLVNSVSDLLKPALYSRLREMIEKVGFHIPQDIYESYGLVISGLGSAVILQKQPTLSEERLSTSRAILRDAASLETHDPRNILQQQNVDSLLNPDVVKLHSKLILLTPVQQTALNGPKRQLLIGPPGTGKTIILQAKALQLLQEGKKILVSTTDSYRERYQQLFKDHGFSNYEITTSLFAIAVNESMIDEFINILDLTESVWQTLQIFSDYVKTTAVMPDWLLQFDAVLIDDVFDDCGWFHSWSKHRRLSTILLMMVISNCSEFSSKLVWIAGDTHVPVTTERHGENFRRTIHQLIGGEESDYFTCVLLHRVSDRQRGSFLWHIPRGYWSRWR